MGVQPRNRAAKTITGSHHGSNCSADDLEAVPLTQGSPSHVHGRGHSGNASPLSHEALVLQPSEKQPNYYQGYNHASLGGGPPPRRSRMVPFVVTLTGVVALLLTGAVISNIGTSPSPGATQPNFITVNSTMFMDGCRPFYPAGFNIDSLVEGSIESVSSRKTNSPNHITSRKMVSSLFSAAKAAKLNVVRTWAHTTDPTHPLQEAPGVYSEEVFQALDYVLAQASLAGLRVSLSFADTWRYRGGIGEYLDWSDTAPPRDPAFPPLIVQGDITPETMTEERQDYEARRRAKFYSDAGSKKMYKAHVAAILNRRNSFNGRRYVEDPTIFAFDLINEPRCDVAVNSRCVELVQAWIEEMAAYFRSLDENHLLTVGEEGFWGPDSPNVHFNPGFDGGSSWGAETGQDFVRNHGVPGISFAAIHAWTDNWNTTSEGFMTNWLTHHAEDAEKLGMPLLLEEFGKKLVPAGATAANEISKIRDPVFRSVYHTIERSMALHGPLQGSLAWEMAFQIYEESPASPYGVRVGDSTFSIVSEHASRVDTLAMHSASTCATEGAMNECWVGERIMLGFVKRCSLRPAACAPVADVDGLWDVDKGALKTMVGAFGSQSECCQPGVGAFANGCTFY